VHCNTGQGRKSSPTVHCCSAKHTHSRHCATAVTLWRFAHHTGVQGLSTNALQHCSGQIVFLTVQCCFAKQACSRHCVTANTPKKICCSYNCAVTEHQCSAALLTTRCIPHCSVLLAKQAHTRHCFTAITPVEVCPSYRCAVTLHQCCEAQFRVEGLPIHAWATSSHGQTVPSLQW